MGIFDAINPIKAIGGIIGSIRGIIDDVHTSEEEKLDARAKLATLEIEFNRAVMQYEVSIAEQQAKVVMAEAQGKSWWQRNWRPTLMFVFMAILVNNFILAPYAQAVFGQSLPLLEIPGPMWGLLTVGVGGYIGARTYEKKVLNNDK